MERITAEQDGQISGTLDLLDAATVLAKHKRLVILFPLIVCAMVAGISFLLPKTYLATARILPPQQVPSSIAAMVGGQVGGAIGLPDLGIGLKNPADLYVGMLKGRTIADALISRFDLQNVYDTDTLVDTRIALDDVTTIKAGRDGIVAIDVEDRDPKRAADIANAYAEELDKLTQTIGVTDAAQRRIFLERQLKLAKEGLAAAEVALKQTQQATGLIQLDEQGKAIIGAVTALRANIASKQVQLSAMRSFATDSNPDFRRAREELIGLKAELTKLEQSTGDGGVILPTRQVPEAGLEYIRRFREVKYQETLFELIAKQYEVARAEEAKETGMVQFIDRAMPPDKKFKPKRRLIVITASAIALFVGVLLAMLLESVRRPRGPIQQERLRRLKELMLGRS